jgi:hypothetical protein
MSDAPPRVWSMPGMAWELVPEVPFEDYEEYRALLDAAVDEYVLMVASSLGGIDFSGRFVVCSLGNYGVPWDVKRLWGKGGTEVLLRLTKGHGREWCELANQFLAYGLDSVLRLHFGNGVVDAMEEGIAREVMGIALRAMANEVQFFMHRRGLNPVGFFTFHHRNFRLARCECVDPNAQYLPVGRVREMQVAFGMGRHARLGEGSLVGLLHPELMRLVFAEGVF